jgi:pyruvate/2-oxoglutarate/acetoin dehydrogenase E1 component
VEEGNPFCSVASEITTQVMEKNFSALKKPVARLTKPNVPQPFSPSLEQEVTITKEKIINRVREILAR